MARPRLNIMVSLGFVAMVCALGNLTAAMNRAGATFEQVAAGIGLACTGGLLVLIMRSTATKEAI